MVFKDLRPQETEVVGMWLDTGGGVIGDAVTDRIEWLTAERLERLAETGEEATLYRDPQDGRLWEKRYPFPGGPPALLFIEPEAAAAKYGVSI